jgi:uncharacterized protein YjbI with pentapeptide repeats
MVTIKHRRSPDVILLRVGTATLDGWDLSEAYLRGANMAGLSCVGTLFRGASLREASLRDAPLRGADLRDADLRGADLRGADLAAARLEGADLTDALVDGHTRWPDGGTPPDNDGLAEDAAPGTEHSCEHLARRLRADLSSTAQLAAPR